METTTEKKTVAIMTDIQVPVTPRAMAVFESRGFTNDHDAQHVEAIKATAASLWSLIDNISIPPGNSEAGRLVSLAKTDVEASVMWAVKAVSRYSPSKNL